MLRFNRCLSGIFIIAFFMCVLSTGVAYATQWAKSYGGASSDGANSVQQTTDGGYIVAGKTYSAGAGLGDWWVLKLNSDGTIAWQKTYGSTEKEQAVSIQQTSDGGYIVTGFTDSFGNGSKFWIIKLFSDGSIEWEKAYDNPNRDEPWSIKQTSDGGYIVTGPNRDSITGDDIWVLKLNSDGSVAWQNLYGGTGTDWSWSVYQTDDDGDGSNDDGYIVAGDTSSFSGTGDTDVWILKLNYDGTVAWQKTYGGILYDHARSIQQTADRGYIVAGSTASFGAGNDDIWVLRLNNDGSIVWQKTYGGASSEAAGFIQQTIDGGYVVTGYTSSFGAGYEDAWVLKLNGDGIVAWEKTFGGAGSDWFPSVQQTEDGGFILAGTTWYLDTSDSDAMVLKINSEGEIGGCSLMGTSSGTVNDSSALISDTNATITIPSIPGNNTTANITSPALPENELCFGCTLTVGKTGKNAGSGTVISSPAGINCGIDCSESFTDSTAVALTATPDYLSIFEGWSGDADCTDGVVTMDSDKTCVAAFVKTWFEENDPAITYTGIWSNYTCALCSGGAIKISNKTGAKATFTFNGTGVKWIAAKAKNLGKAKVYVDGVYKTTIDLYSAASTVKQPASQVTGLTPGSHTITIVVTGQKNASSTGYYIDIDAFEVVP